MDKVRIGLKRKRVAVYVVLIAGSIAACFVRAVMVTADRSRQITAYESEWARSGKPVVVRTVAAKDVLVFSQFTVRGVSGKTGKGFVTGEVKESLRPGQEIYTEDKSAVCAAVVSVGSNVDLNTGMFPVEVEFDKPCEVNGLAVVAAHTRTLRNVVAVPIEIVDIDAGVYSLWTVENGRAKKVVVSIGSRDGYGAVIASGLQSGSRVVFRGQSLLRDNDKVMIVGAEPNT